MSNDVLIEGLKSHLGKKCKRISTLGKIMNIRDESVIDIVKENPEVFVETGRGWVRMLDSVGDHRANLREIKAILGDRDILAVELVKCLRLIKQGEVEQVSFLEALSGLQPL